MSILSNLFPKGSESGSISLSEQMHSLEWIEATRDAAVQLWRTSMMSLSRALPAMPKQIGEPHRKSLRGLAEEFPSRPGPVELEQYKQKTVEVLESYGVQMGSYLESQDREAKAVLHSVAQLTETIAGLDQRHAVKLQGVSRQLRELTGVTDLGEIRARLAAEVEQLERVVEEQQRESRMAFERLRENLSTSEVRRKGSIPGPGSQHASQSLRELEAAVRGWDRFCLVRYEFQAKPGTIVAAQQWEPVEKPLRDAVPEKLGMQASVVVPKAGVMLAAVQCQLLEYAGQAESMERTLGHLCGVVCHSRVVEPLRGEGMREAMTRLEKAG